MGSLSCREEMDLPGSTTLSPMEDLLCAQEHPAPQQGQPSASVATSKHRLPMLSHLLSSGTNCHPSLIAWHLGLSCLGTTSTSMLLSPRICPPSTCYPHVLHHLTPYFLHTNHCRQLPPARSPPIQSTGARPHLFPAPSCFLALPNIFHYSQRSHSLEIVPEFYTFLCIPFYLIRKLALLKNHLSSEKAGCALSLGTGTSLHLELHPTCQSGPLSASSGATSILPRLKGTHISGSAPRYQAPAWVLLNLIFCSLFTTYIGSRS